MKKVSSITLGAGAMNALMPMHLIIAKTGHIERVGPTLGKLREAGAIEGQRWLEVFECHRPLLKTGTFDEICDYLGTPIVLQFRDAPRTKFKGILLRAPRQDRLIINLSFGISAIDAVGDYDLTNSDFAATDLTIEMLYLQEAKATVAAALKRLNKELEWSRDLAAEEAQTDQLTGLGNRRAMEKGFARALASPHGFGLMHIDLDHFKQVNDTLGHAAGDAVLVAAAQRMQEQMRKTDLVARVGGDEFVVVLEGMTDMAKLGALGTKLIEALEVPVPFEEHLCRISGSIGYTASALYDVVDPARLVEDADQALYRAKDAGRGVAIGFDQSDPNVSAA